MPPKDLFHDSVRRALEKDGWTITREHLPLKFELGDMYVDLGAEKIVEAQRDSEKIAVEIKSFVRASGISEFHTALGQFLNYRFALSEQEPERELYLAVPSDTYTSLFNTRLVQNAIRTYGLKLIVYNPKLEVVVQWIR